MKFKFGDKLRSLQNPPDIIACIVNNKIFMCVVLISTWGGDVD
jgi:hypothetical protein